MEQNNSKVSSFERLRRFNKGGLRCNAYGTPHCFEHGLNQCMNVDGLYLNCCPGSSSLCKQQCLIEMIRTMREVCDQKDTIQRENAELKRQLEEKDVKISRITALRQNEQERPKKRVTFQLPDIIENGICLTLAEQEIIRKFGPQLIQMILADPKNIKPYNVAFDFVFDNLTTLEEKKLLINHLNNDLWLIQFKKAIIKSISDSMLVMVLPYDQLKFLQEGIRNTEKIIDDEERKLLC